MRYLVTRAAEIRGFQRANRGSSGFQGFRPVWGADEAPTGGRALAIEMVE
jgi:hypothetical protein